MKIESHTRAPPGNDRAGARMARRSQPTPGAPVQRKACLFASRSKPVTSSPKQSRHAKEASRWVGLEPEVTFLACLALACSTCSGGGGVARRNGKASPQRYEGR